MISAEYKEEKAKLDKAHKEAIEELHLNWRHKCDVEMATLENKLDEETEVLNNRNMDKCNEALSLLLKPLQQLM